MFIKLWITIFVYRIIHSVVDKQKQVKPPFVDNIGAKTTVYPQHIHIMWMV